MTSHKSDFSIYCALIPKAERGAKPRHAEVYTTFKGEAVTWATTAVERQNPRRHRCRPRIGAFPVSARKMLQAERYGGSQQQQSIADWQHAEGCCLMIAIHVTNHGGQSDMAEAKPVTCCSIQRNRRHKVLPKKTSRLQ